MANESVPQQNKAVKILVAVGLPMASAMWVLITFSKSGWLALIAAGVLVFVSMNRALAVADDVLNADSKDAISVS